MKPNFNSDFWSSFWPFFFAVLTGNAVWWGISTIANLKT